MKNGKTILLIVVIVAVPVILYAAIPGFRAWLMGIGLIRPYRASAQLKAAIANYAPYRELQGPEWDDFAGAVSSIAAKYGHGRTTHYWFTAMGDLIQSIAKTIRFFPRFFRSKTGLDETTTPINTPAQNFYDQYHAQIIGFFKAINVEPISWNVQQLQPFVEHYIFDTQQGTLPHWDIKTGQSL